MGAPSDSVRRYVIEGEIGRGGMGVVYRAHDEKLQRPVALKMLSLSSEGLRERFLREARTLARFNHPHIATIYALEETHDGQLYLALELIEGQNLAERLSDAPISMEESLAIGRQVASALEAAHGRGIVHRDLKPANVMIDGEGAAKVLDFGLARPLGEGAAPGLTLGGLVLGTPGYMSPEQIRGEDVDRRTDVFAFGCVLYECLCGTMAFPGESIGASLASTLTRDPDWDRLPSDTPPSIHELLRACLSRDPSERPEIVRISDGASAEMIAAGGVTPSRAHNLPAEVTSFVGREHVLDQLTEIQPGTRLLTLTGPGGAGKTRLSLRLVQRLSDPYPAGIWFVELAPIGHPEHIASTVLAALGHAPVPGSPMEDELCAFLSGRDALLVLDNCEHLLPSIAELTERVLAECPSVDVLATSREPLGVAGETSFLVPSLSPPEAGSAAETIERSESVQLFVERARAAKPGFRLGPQNAASVAAICRRLDGIPLALELAAARVRAMTPAAILERLDASFRILTGGRTVKFERHHTMRAALDWSHDLLSPEERVLFRRLCVFHGGWALEAAEAVGSDGEALSEEDVLELLTALVEKSMVLFSETRDGRGRYRLLEVGRLYGLEKLANDPRDAEATRDRHALWCLEFARAQRSKKTRSVAAVESECANLLGALDWCAISPRSLDTGFRLAHYAGSLFKVTGNHAGWWSRYCALLRQDSADLDSQVVARMRRAAATVAYYSGEYRSATELLTQCAESAEDEVDVARRLIFRALNLAGARELDQAAEQLSEVRRPAEDHGGWLLVFWLNTLGEVTRMGGDPDAARTSYERALPLTTPATWWRSVIAHNLASVLCLSGRPTEALPLLQESLLYCWEAADKNEVLGNIEASGLAAAALGDHGRAADMHAIAADLRRRHAAPIEPGDVQVVAELEAAVRAHATREDVEHAHRLARDATLESAYSSCMRWITAQREL